jgi:hypothetical protein
MKQLITFFTGLFIVFTADASHMMGGDITWRCSGNNYIFTLKVYRDCRGVGFTTAPQTITVVNHPTITSIICVNIAVNDLSPANCGYHCSQTFPPQGAKEEYIFESAPINLGNVPPPLPGWIFTWNLCCRNSTILNISNPGGLGMTLRSKMFAYNGQSVSPCNNTAPAFAEKPITLICGGYNFQHAETALEPDHDSLSYSCDQGADGFPPGLTLIPYSLPYTTNSQIPGNPSLDSFTGLISCSPAAGTQGDFVTCVRVNEYRCGQKISEIYREIQRGISGMCGPVSGGGINTPPQLLDPVTLQPFTEMIDTVYVGDTVNFNFLVSDPQLDISTSLPQTITVNTYSTQLGTNDTSVFGCPLPPCATLTTSTPVSFQMGDAIGLNWVTDCSHVLQTGCYQAKTLYQFLINMKDDFCPSPAINDYVYSVYVVGPSVTTSATGDTLFCNFPNGTLQWYLNGSPIAGATGNFIVPAVSGVYTVAALMPTPCAVASAPVNVVISGVNEYASVYSAVIIPNPSNGNFILKLQSISETEGTILITDVSGRIVFSSKKEILEGENNFHIDLSTCEKGVYVLQVLTSNGAVNRKVILD